MKILNLTQHAATPEQIAAGVVNLPADVRAEVSRLLTFEELPDYDEVRCRAWHLANIVREHVGSGDAVMLGGAPYLMGPLETNMRAIQVRAVYAFSRRESVEQVQPDGSVRKVNVFRHAGFVQA